MGGAPHQLIAFGAAFLAGAINSVAGGGTLVSFPVLVWLGLPSTIANATSTVAIWPGSLGGMLGFRRDLNGMAPRMYALIVPSLVGGIAGAVLLRLTPTSLFDRLVPLLILFATGLFMAQDAVQRLLRIAPRDLASPKPQSGEGGGTIRATVTDPQGGTFSVVFVQAKREPSGPTINGQRGADGTYTISAPAGTYELSVNVPAMKSFRRGGLVVASGQTLQLDVRLEDTVSLRTLGEDPTAIVATFFNRPDPPKGRTPRLTNGKPDLTGVWLGGPTDLGGLDLQAWAAALA